MADIEYYDDGYSPHDTSPRAPHAAGSFGLVNWFGAITSIALVAGLAVWAVQLTLKDVSEVPVIRALEGPMRVQPVDPGGLQAAHQGLAVNGIKAGEGAAPAAERIVLAPPPVNLDLPAPAIRGGQAATAAAPTERSVEDLASALAAGIKPLEAAPIEQAIAASATAPAGAVRRTAPTPDAIPATVPGIAVSRRPVVRPASRPAPVAQPAATSTAAITPSGSADLDPSAIASGTRLVQLGAFDSPEIARREWDRLYGIFGDYMEGKQRVVQQARSGGRDFYRLRVAGFGDANDARRFCSAFLARNTACIPVVAR